MAVNRGIHISDVRSSDISGRPRVTVRVVTRGALLLNTVRHVHGFPNGGRGGAAGAGGEADRRRGQRVERRGVKFGIERLAENCLGGSIGGFLPNSVGSAFGRDRSLDNASRQVQETQGGSRGGITGV